MDFYVACAHHICVLENRKKIFFFAKWKYPTNWNEEILLLCVYGANNAGIGDGIFYCYFDAVAVVIILIFNHSTCKKYFLYVHLL